MKPSVQVRTSAASKASRRRRPSLLAAFQSSEAMAMTLAVETPAKSRKLCMEFSQFRMNERTLPMQARVRCPA